MTEMFWSWRGEAEADGSPPCEVICDRRGAVATVTLSRPQRRNAYTPTMALGLRQALATLDSDDTVRAVVITGAGEHFGVGADLDVQWRDPAVHSVEEMTEPDTAPWNLVTPLIVAINGDAIGVQLTWAMQCDIRVVASDARLAFSFNRIGIMPDRNSLWLLPRLVGASRAMDLLMTGRTFDGNEAERMGLVSRSVPRHELLQTALAIADDIATYCAPASVTATKQLLYRFLETGDRLAAYNSERRALTWIRTLGETLRGIEAFRTKQPPKWGSQKSQRVPPNLY